MIKLTVLISYLLFAQMTWGAETCSRIATINYQDVLVDVSSNNRGEGLRYYLEKDPFAKDLLDEYQENNRPTWQSAALSTLGTGMIITSFMVTSQSDSSLTNRNTLLFGGATMIAISYLISITKQYNNEYLLSKSVEEYNKRNTPKIYFSPTDPKHGMGAGVGIGQEF